MDPREKAECPVCGECALGRISYSRTISVGDQSGTVDGFQKSVCENCGSSVAGADEMRHNKRLVTAFSKRVSGLLTGQEIAEIRKGFLLTQKDASLIFGGGPVAFSKYESDDVSQSLAMDKLLRVVRGHPHILREMADEAGVELKESQRIGVNHGRRKDDGARKTAVIQFPPGFTPVDNFVTFGVFKPIQPVAITDEDLENASQSAAA